MEQYNYQCIYFIDKGAFPTQKKRMKVLKYLPSQIKVLTTLTGNPKVDRFILDNSEYWIYKQIARQAIIDAEIKKDLYWVQIIGSNIKPNRKDL